MPDFDPEQKLGRKITNIYNYYECRLDYPMNKTHALKGTVSECKKYCEDNKWCKSFDYCKYGAKQDNWCHIKDMDTQKHYTADKNRLPGADLYECTEDMHSKIDITKVYLNTQTITYLMAED